MLVFTLVPGPIVTSQFSELGECFGSDPHDLVLDMYSCLILFLFSSVNLDSLV